MIANLIVLLLIIITGVFFLGEENWGSSREKALVLASNDPAVRTNYLLRYSRYNDALRKRYIIVVCMMLVLQSGLRNIGVGADSFSYYQYFEGVKDLTWPQIITAIMTSYYFGVDKDPGYLVLQKLVQYIVDDYQMYLFLIAIFFFVAFGNFVYKNTTRISDAIIAFVIYISLFYYFFSITGHRQTLATACVFFSYEYLKQRRFWHFLLILLVAATLHKSCLVFLPFYFIAPVKKINLLFWSIVLFPLLLSVSNISAEFINEITGSYKEYVHYDELTPVIFTITLLIIALGASMFFRKAAKYYPEAIRSFNAYAVAIIFTSQVFAIHGYMRIVQYFSVFLVLLIPAVLKMIERKSAKVRTMVYILAVFMLIMMSIRTGWGTEYKFFWQQMDVEKDYW